ncbi:Uncharacterized conserved protein, DUF169 family [Hathewaya proteolytica DSM 3090]|uniref:Uncharacterized conserved protein, DUF169 family n=1 Tax=Hathewaya proteolytica DSM 3090 TaxID=1121331 RepID=A0A1M6LQW8_9CLOT|nr:DUF169 domain-containing protein [Hathewaya proteolytica]SHJ73472.1 Uncharacterized conserved protein, DUF169 family [Hathewaya proteolytica DSM 3090]
MSLNREIIGVKFLKTEEEYLKQDAQDIKKDMIYCVFIKSAMTGKSLKIRGENFACSGSGTTFRYHDLPEGFYDGEWVYTFGLHKSMEISKEVMNDMLVFEEKTYGVVAKPLNKFVGENPDVIIIVCEPYYAMRLSQAYSYEFGLKQNYDIAGNQAVCYESTAKPIMTKSMDLSMLCAGTRHSAKWEKNEMMCGISWEISDAILEGLIKTINTIEPDDMKKTIIKKNGSNIIEDTEITFGTAYYLKK